jgi:hypothetical protein
MRNTGSDDERSPELLLRFASFQMVFVLSGRFRISNLEVGARSELPFWLQGVIPRAEMQVNCVPPNEEYARSGV